MGRQINVAYDEKLAQRIRRVLADHPGVREKEMFGGLAFLIRGNTCCGIIKQNLMVRVGAAQYEEALARPHARPMDFTGRPLRGYVYVAPEGLRSAHALRSWVERGVALARSLPAR